MILWEDVFFFHIRCLACNTLRVVHEQHPFVEWLNEIFEMAHLFLVVSPIACFIWSGCQLLWPPTSGSCQLTFSGLRVWICTVRMCRTTKNLLQTDKLALTFLKKCIKGLYLNSWSRTNVSSIRRDWVGQIYVSDLYLWYLFASFRLVPVGYSATFH